MNASETRKMDSKEGINALFLYATEGIMVVDDKGIIVRINPSAEKLFGYDNGELTGKKLGLLIPGRFSESHQKYHEGYSSNPHPRVMGKGMTLYGLKKNGDEIPVEISLSPYSTPEGRFVIAFIIDITLRKQAEEKLKNYSVELETQVKNRTLILEEAIQELEKTKLELRQALEKEKELNELKSRFVSMASHEFRTPLATILSSLSLVTKYGEQNDKENQIRHVAKIKSSINNLTDILNDFLSVSRLEEGKIECTPEPLGIEDFFTDTITEMKGVLKKGQVIHYSHEGKKDTVLDKKLLKNILFNLISNAIKFSPEESKIEIQTIHQNAFIKFLVKDSGIGIPEDDQKNLFDRFFRGHNATHIQGTGLGLNIVARYVEMMNGTIDFKSKENEGTVFYITLPQ